ncbi:MAG: tripartite tricarboxylate transporter substrate binding protein [Betaproteobacteria bacterium]|nr:tripartite tricarboxylate transporter substrate binding protein [Betaproteobacteria bacterium]
MSMFRFIAAVSAALTFAGTALAQYPARQIKMVVMTQAGGAPDIIGRLLAARLAESFGQAVVVENRAGSNGNIAGEYVAKSPADGYTLLVTHDALFSISPHIYAKMPFDPNRDLVPVATIAAQDFVLAVHPSVPAKTLQEFIDFARKSNPPLNYASTGNGAQQHLAMEMLKARAGLNMAHIPYKGGAGATVAMVAGDVSVTIGGSSMDPQIKAGKLRALATTGARRAPSYPNLPAIGEMFPGYTISVWIGLFAPAATPVEVLTRLRGEVDKFLANPETRQKLYASGGMDPYPLRPEEIVLGMRRDYEKFGKLIKEIGLRVD